MHKNINIKYVINYYRYYLLFICIGFIVYSITISSIFGFQNVDDAYISFRYGWNLMEGNGLVYNKGEYVEGYTNFLWTIITAPFTSVRSVDIPLFTIVLGITISAMILIVLTTVTKNLLPDITPFLIIFPAAVLASDSSFVFWGVSGMETTLFTFLMLSVFYLYSRLNENGKLVNYISIFLILAALCRPEGNMLFGFIIANMLIYRNKFTGFKSKFLKILVTYTVVISLYYAFKYIYYGSVLPNTFYAKAVSDTANNYIAGIDYLRVSFKARYLILLAIVFIPVRQVFKDYRLSFLFTFTLAYLGYIVYAGGDWPGASRFIMPVLPFIYILCAVCIARIYNYLKSSGNTVIKKSAVFIVFLSFILASVNAYKTFKKLEPYTFLDTIYINYETECKKLGEQLNKMNNPELKIALAPAGKIAYYSGLYCIDMWGLNDKHIASVNSKSETAAHRKHDFNYILSRRPDYIIGYAGFSRDMVPGEYILTREANPDNGYLPVYKLNK